MSARRTLEASYKMDQRIESKMLIIESLRAKAERVNAPLGGVVVDGGTKSSREDVIIRIMELEEEVTADLMELIRLKGEAVRIIESIEHPDKRTETDMKLILELRYVNSKRWEEIADIISLSEPRVYELHAEAMKTIAKHSKP